ncbi:hypothetical protein [Streptomyces wuyuanensis]|uniref:hypothetical protein n=1 Tax=Streptomyces wuyuanensis TaxID=1196353 RepID=UPI00341F5257
MREMEGVRAIGEGFFEDAVLTQPFYAQGQFLASLPIQNMTTDVVVVAVFLVISGCGLVLIGHRH